ncbi:hypothetical protein ACFL08_03605 [Patescibacteria group bacterium]
MKTGKKNCEEEKGELTQGIYMYDWPYDLILKIYFTILFLKRERKSFFTHKSNSEKAGKNMDALTSEIRINTSAVAKRLKRLVDNGDIIACDIEAALDEVVRSDLNFRCLLKCISAFRKEDLLNADLAWEYLFQIKGLLPYLIEHPSEGAEYIAGLCDDDLDRSVVQEALGQVVQEMAQRDLCCESVVKCVEALQEKGLLDINTAWKYCSHATGMAQFILEDPSKAANDITRSVEEGLRIALAQDTIRLAVQDLRPDQLCLKSVARYFGKLNFLDITTAWEIVCGAMDLANVAYKRPTSCAKHILAFVEEGLDFKVVKEAIRAIQVQDNDNWNQNALKKSIAIIEKKIDDYK